MILEESDFCMEDGLEAEKKKQEIGGKIRKLGKSLRDDEDLNWSSGTGDGEDKFERCLKGRIVVLLVCRRMGQGEGLAHIHSIHNMINKRVESGPSS